MRPFAAALLVLLVHVTAASAQVPPHAAPASAVSEDIPVPGGTAALCAIIGVDPVDRAVFVGELARRLYATPEGRVQEIDKTLASLRSYLDEVDHFQQALAAAQPQGGSISLASAADKRTRKSLDPFLDYLDLELHESKHVFTVASAGRWPGDRARVLKTLKVDPAAIAHELNAGHPVHVDVPVETVPVPLPASAWNTAVFGHAVSGDALLSAILADRRASLLAYGLSSLDDATLAYLAATPDVVKRLYRDDAPVFAAYGRSLHVAGGRVVTPGGPDAAPLWDAVVGASSARPAEFARHLFEEHGGRIAYLYDAISNLDEPHARFALGLWVKDAGARRDRFRALADVSNSAYSSWQPTVRPFSRAPMDLLMLLSRVAVTADGAPAMPNQRAFWTAVFASADLPDRPERELRDVEKEGVVDAAWLAEHIVSQELAPRTDRLDQLAFAQRVFGTAPAAALPDALVATRALPRLRTLMLTLDRIGIEDPATYSAAARRAVALSGGDRTRAFESLGQFQASLALVTRLRLAGVIDPPRAQQLVTSLVKVDLADGRYRGAIAGWIEHSLLAALPALTSGTPETADDRLRRGLAGDGSPKASHEATTFEGQHYRLDLAGAELRRLNAVLARQRDYDLAAVLAFRDDVQKLQAAAHAGSPDVNAIHALAEQIRTDGAAFHRDPTPPPPGVDARDPAGAIADAVKHLGGIRKADQAGRADEDVERLSNVCDDLLTHALLSYAYALALGDPQGTVLLGGNVARRHDFGLAATSDDERARAPWQVATQQFAEGTAWHLRGSVLGLDVAMASLSLRRVVAGSTAPPVLDANAQRTFVEDLALLDAYDLADADRDAIAAAVTRGRARVAALRGHPDNIEGVFDAVLSLRVDGRRRRAIAWVLTHTDADPEPWFALSELFVLGSPAAGTHVDAWGSSALPSAACFCTGAPVQAPWPLYVGQTATGLLPARMLDLNLRVAELTAEMKLPAGVTRGILTAALQDYIDRVKPFDDYDWIALVRTAQRVTRDEVEDAVAGLTADGTLAPIADPGGAL